jgi:hypothetical protein
MERYLKGEMDGRVHVRSSRGPQKEGIIAFPQKTS